MTSEKITNKNYIYFKDNFEKITRDHLNEFVVIRDCQVQVYYPTFDDAINAMIEKGYAIGSFIVQECTKSIDTTFAIYYSTYLNKFIRIGD